MSCIRSGFDGGHAKAKGCECLVEYDNYDLFIHNRVDIKDFYAMPDSSDDKKRDYYNY